MRSTRHRGRGSWLRTALLVSPCIRSG